MSVKSERSLLRNADQGRKAKKSVRNRKNGGRKGLGARYIMCSVGLVDSARSRRHAKLKLVTVSVTLSIDELRLIFLDGRASQRHFSPPVVKANQMVRNTSSVRWKRELSVVWRTNRGFW